jgi:hypothetical protein
MDVLTQAILMPFVAASPQHMVPWDKPADEACMSKRLRLLHHNFMAHAVQLLKAMLLQPTWQRLQYGYISLCLQIHFLLAVSVGIILLCVHLKKRS